MIEDALHPALIIIIIIIINYKELSMQKTERFNPLAATSSVGKACAKVWGSGREESSIRPNNCFFQIINTLSSSIIV